MGRFLLCIALLTGCVDGETEEPSLDQTPPSDHVPVNDTPAGDFATFMACMQFEDFQSANMATAWSSADEAQSCSTCHADVFGPNAQKFFDALKQRVYVQLQFFSFDKLQGVIVNERSIPAMGKNTTHPRFNANAGMQATRTLYDLTKARLAAGNCP